MSSEFRPHAEKRNDLFTAYNFPSPLGGDGTAPRALMRGADHEERRRRRKKRNREEVKMKAN
jgi:hypothetical protein